MTSSAMPTTCPQVEPIKYCYELDSSSLEFSDTSSSFLDSSLIWKSSVLGNEAEDSDEEIV